MFGIFSNVMFRDILYDDSRKVHGIVLLSFVASVRSLRTIL